ncbi:AAA family ATPase [Cetobacterium sp. 8H]|uniref:AAA family ATPase n=1 Tax=Cetobacterium sp. 8H TaxID=2759681 RepID=UPI00163B94E0|nr:ATP-binding protein [Cetobacterium sp. 8H]MBC2849880.1 AAA family ATPase [Cetobacterium sp. 8H]
MKVKNIHFKNHKVLKNLEIDFINNGEVLNNIVIAGINGSGKTNLLKYIYDYFDKNYYYNNDLTNSIKFVFEKEEEEINELIYNNLFNSLKLYEHNRLHNPEDPNFKLLNNSLKILPKIIYIPTEINFQNIQTTTNMLERKYEFLNIVDTNLISNIASYIATRVTYISNTEEDLTGKEVREKVAKEINDIFSILDLDIKLQGLSRDERSMPIFSNSIGEEFDINDLSSGEKQLFVRTLAIKMLEPENSIILIDEPELSLHPKWQQKILEVYKKIGKNNQIIIATHSPHILGSVPKENLIILTRDENGEIKALKDENLYSSLGQPVDRILEDIMGLETTRDPKIFSSLNKLRELVNNNQYDSDEFKNLMKEMTLTLGNTDGDLMLIKMDVNIRRKQRGE